MWRWRRFNFLHNPGGHKSRELCLKGDSNDYVWPLLKNFKYIMAKRPIKFSWEVHILTSYRVLQTLSKVKLWFCPLACGFIEVVMIKKRIFQAGLRKTSSELRKSVEIFLSLCWIWRWLSKQNKNEPDQFMDCGGLSRRESLRYYYFL